MRQLLNHCLVRLRREQKVKVPLKPRPVLSQQEYRAAVAQLAKQLRLIL